MKKGTDRTLARSATAASVFLLLITGGAACADTERELPTWLVGCWVSEDERSLEAWTKDSDTTLIGFSSVVSDNKVVFYELMSIRLGDQGALTFTAYPSNQPGGSFPAVSEEEQAVTFLNEDHDYPQRIRYRRDGDKLLADIARVDGEQQTDFRKTRCQ